MYAAKNEDGSGAVDEDWRDFRAQLVRSEKDDTATPSKNKPPEKQKKDDEEHWAYETGDLSPPRTIFSMMSMRSTTFATVNRSYSY